LCAAVCAAAAAAGCGGSSSDDRSPTPGPPPPTAGLDARPVNLTCVAPSAPAAGSPEIALEEAFPHVGFTQPLAMIQAPGDDSRWFVLEKPGRVLVIDNDPNVTAAETVLDVDAFLDVNDASEGGLLGMAFDPAFAENGTVYLSFTEGTPMVSVVKRFTSPDGTTLDPAAEDVLRVNQPFENHNGGQIGFGPDGYLYIGLGDGGSGGDPQGHAQNTKDLLGSMLRIDVAGDAPYEIPADNPFAGNPTCGPDPNVPAAADCPEIYAWGLRNPWRWSFDADTGALWVGDVGQGTREEIDVVERGGNYGWNCREGRIAYPGTHSPACADATGLIDPVHDYPRSEGTSVTGGYVYRGTAIPALVGSYVFGDYGSGRIWRLAGDGAGGYTAELLLDTNLAISSFAEGLDRELYVVDLVGGGLYRIVAAGDRPSGSPVPESLSATGCVDSADPARPAAGLIPYDVAAPFWSDGADKERWLAVPDGTTIAVGADGDFAFPEGAVLMKHFRLDGRLVETRLLMHHPRAGWAGYSYRWNDAQTDATLVEGGAVAEIGGRQWIFPSSDDCLACHTSAAGFTLGLETAQLDNDFTYPATGRTANQLETLDAIALFASPLAPSSGEALADPYDAAAPLDARARAYLHTNCAQCHREGGLAPVALDLRYDVRLAETGACDALPQAGDLGLGAGARIIAPGEPERSVLLGRLERRDAYAMPPLASNVVDAEGAALIREWIASLAGCG
ncbi:MAG TPA: PQQ-dependent sugar dehydrogenase, partial [Gammaproteobacteria bacterium]